MGQEAICTVHTGGTSAQGKAVLETDVLLFQGDVRLRLPFAEMDAVDHTALKFVIPLWLRSAL